MGDAVLRRRSYVRTPSSVVGSCLRAGDANPDVNPPPSEAFVEKTFQVNLFGAMKVTQAILPHLRERRSGTIGYVGAGLA